MTRGLYRVLRGVRSARSVLSGRYAGFKCTLVCVLLVSELIALIAAGTFQPLPRLRGFLTPLWGQYIYVYWYHHVGMFLLIGFIFLSVFHFDVLEESFTSRIRPSATHPAADRMESMLRRVNAFLVSLLWIETIAVIPVLHLTSPPGLMAIALAGPVLLTAVGQWYSVTYPMTAPAPLRKKSGFRFPKSRSFNTASLAVEAFEVSEELGRYERIQQLSPRSASAIEYLRSGDPSTLWRGYRTFFGNLARALEVPADWISCHRSTTEAISHAIEVVSQSSACLIVTTDLEYSSVQAETQRLAKRYGAPLEVLPLRAEHLAGVATPDVIARDLCEFARDAIARHPGIDRVIVLFSHVVFETGAVLPVLNILEQLSSGTGDAKVATIVDGAQAAGNIVIPPEVFRKTDFYATSGHKWLMGKPALGILLHSRERLDRFGISASQIPDRRIPYSFVNYDPDADVHGQSTNLTPMISLNAMLHDIGLVGINAIAEHNRELARTFAGMLRFLSADVVTNPIESGILTIRFDKSVDARRVKERLESEHKMVCEALDRDLLRFAFHYYMGHQEVYELVSALQGVMRSKNTRSENEYLLVDMDVLRRLVVEITSDRSQQNRIRPESVGEHAESRHTPAPPLQTPPPKSPDHKGLAG